MKVVGVGMDKRKSVDNDGAVSRKIVVV